MGFTDTRTDPWIIPLPLMEASSPSTVALVRLLVSHTDAVTFELKVLWLPFVYATWRITKWILSTGVEITAHASLWNIRPLVILEWAEILVPHLKWVWVGTVRECVALCVVWSFSLRPLPPPASQVTAADGPAEESYFPSDSRAARSSGSGWSAEDRKEWPGISAGKYSGENQHWELTEKLSTEAKCDGSKPPGKMSSLFVLCIFTSILLW